MAWLDDGPVPVVALHKSVERQIGANNVRAFSSFDDLLRARIDRGEVSSREDLLENHLGLLGAMLFDWYRQGQIACVFAQQLSRDPSSAAWQSVTVGGEVDPKALDEVLIQAAEKLEAKQLIFPGEASVQHALDLVLSLCSHTSWLCHEMPWMPNEVPDSLLVGLRWIPHNANYTSWVLGIAPFETMPFTRRLEGAPFIALVLRPGPPTEFAPPKEEFGRVAAHLAHMDDRIGANDEKRQKTRNATERAKAALLGGEPRSRARAKVTFALPAETRPTLAPLFERSKA